MATQLGFLTVKPEFELGASLADVLKLVSSQPGFQKWYYGFQVKNPSVLQVLVDWESADAYHKFKESSAFGQWTAGLSGLAEGPVKNCLAKLSPHPAPAFAAPTSEVVFINEPFDDFADSLAEFSKWLVTMPGQEGAYSVGEIVEGNDGHQLYLVVGWESVEAQKAMMATEAFKGKVGLVKDHCQKVALDYVQLTRS